MNKNIKKINNEKYAVVLGFLVDLVGAFCFIKLISFNMTKGDVGEYFIVVSVMTLFLTVTYSAFDQGVLRYIGEYIEKKVIFSKYSLLIFLYAISAPLAFVFFINFFLKFRFFELEVVIFLGVLVYFEALKNSQLVFLNGQRKRWSLSLLKTLDWVFKIVAVFLISKLFNLSPNVLLLILAGSSLIIFLISVYMQRTMLTRFRCSEILPTIQDVISFAWPMMIWGGFGWIQNMSSRWLLDYLLDADAVAEYGVMITLASLPGASFLGLVTAYIVPIIYSKEQLSKGSSRSDLKRVALGVFCFGLLAVVFSSFFHEQIMRLISNDAYVRNSTYMPISMFAYVFSSSFTVLAYEQFVKKNLFKLMVPSIVPGLIMLGSGYFLISNYGFAGAVYSLLITHFFIGVMYFMVFIFER